LEFIGPVGSTNGNGQGVDTRPLNKLHRLVGVGELGLSGANPVFNPAQGPQFTLDGDAAVMGVFHHFAGDLDIILKVRRGLAVLHQGTVDHHRGKAEVNSAFNRIHVVPVVQVDGDGDLRGQFHRCLDYVNQILVL